MADDVNWIRWGLDGLAVVAAGCASYLWKRIDTVNKDLKELVTKKDKEHSEIYDALRSSDKSIALGMVEQERRFALKEDLKSLGQYFSQRFDKIESSQDRNLNSVTAQIQKLQEQLNSLTNAVITKRRGGGE